MPALSWSSLQVVAADGLTGERGTAMRTPILRDEGGRLLVPSGVGDETVTPRQVLRRDEVRELLDGGVWIPVQPMQAKQHHVLVLRGAPFAAACRTVELGDDLRWSDHHGRIDIAYVDRPAAVQWRARCAECFMHRAGKYIGEYLCLGYRAPLAAAHTLLELALFVTNPGTPTRQRLFVLLGVAMNESFSTSWPTLMATALAESPVLDRAQLDRDIETARSELKAHAERHSPKSWTIGPTLWRQPAVLY